MIQSLLKDKTFILAIILGPLTWFILSFIIPLKNSFHLSSQLILGIVCWPLVEELFFRGTLQHYACRYYPKHIYTTIIVVSLLFSICHLYNHTTIWAGLVFFPSLCFGYFYHQYKSILPSYILHAWYNAGLFILF
ncbi:MAG: JDVT-CTERM system CAAX-type protease [Candidatus Cloacimonetes bacterium]|nr:JDVT-CTERM system CAAX-type protease [Candidatus Cloacimonadota bacterium]